MSAELVPVDQPDEDPDRLVQMNVRVPKSLRDAIDARRAQLVTEDGRAVSRDKWATRVFSHAVRLPMPGARPAPTGPGMRVAPPPHRRPPLTN